ncbi:MAG: TetR/AcrR family transcriptional regulator [Betaproteobacteria bacterium]
MKETIYRAAMKVFATRGYERATIDEIVARAGIAKGTVYYHFGSKKDLFLSLVEEGFAQLLQRVRSAVARPEDTRRRLERLIDAHVEFVRDETDFCRLLLSEGPEFRWRKQLRKLHDEYVATLTDFIRQGQAEGTLAEVDPELALHTIFGAVTMLALDYVVLGEEIEWRRIAPQIKQIIFHGLLA